MQSPCCGNPLLLRSSLSFSASPPRHGRPPPSPSPAPPVLACRLAYHSSRRLSWTSLSSTSLSSTRLIIGSSRSNRGRIRSKSWSCGGSSSRRRILRARFSRRRSSWIWCSSRRRDWSSISGSGRSRSSKSDERSIGSEREGARNRVWCSSSLCPFYMARGMQLKGTLFRYGPQPAQVAFRSGDFKVQVIFIGGLTDGLLATEYLEPLANALETEKWSLVQPLLSSSYTGFGISSLKQDALELEQLITYLINNETSHGVMLLGHSTGCQDIVHYMRTGSPGSRAVRGAILQAPVSDREYRATIPGTAAMIDLAESMIKEGRSMDLMPRDACSEAPISAYRYRSLCAYMGDDDMFSSDLTDHQLRLRLGHMSRVPCQVIFSMADEYVPDYVDKPALVQRLCEAMGEAEKVEIQWGNHSLSNRIQEAVHSIMDFVKREGPKGWDDPWR